jgi:hypothetical protein
MRIARHINAKYENGWEGGREGGMSNLKGTF